MARTTQIRVLWIAVIALAVLNGFSLLRPPRIPEEISVERLNIVEPDGNLAFALANSQRPTAATIDGQVIMRGQEEERRLPSMTFFDGKGDEVGGMMMGVRETADGYSAVRHLSLDAYKHDQTIQLVHAQDPGGSQSALIISDRPGDISLPEVFDRLGLQLGATREQLSAAIGNLPEDERAGLRQLFGGTRLFLGVSREGDAELVLLDGEGRPRIRLVAPEEGEPSIQVLNERGEVLSSLQRCQDLPQ